MKAFSETALLMARGLRTPCLSAIATALIAVPGVAAKASSHHGPAKVASTLGEAPALTPGMGASPDSRDAVEFLVGSQTLILQLPPGVVPSIVAEKSPVRLVIRLPGLVLPAGRAAFGSGLVSSYEISAEGTGTLAVLYLRRALREKPGISYYAGRVLIAVVPSLALAPEMVITPEPLIFPSPKDKPTPRPTSFGPPVRITPVPMPNGTSPLPVPRDIPPIGSIPGGNT